MEQRKLTKEDLERAESYIPLVTKYAVAQVLAPGCVEKVEGTPPLWQENIIGRKLVELYILSGFYLHITDTSGLDRETPEFVFTLEDYDRLSGLRRDFDRLSDDKCKEILEDYGEFLGILDRQIDSLLARRNDILARFGELAAMGATPEVFQALREAAESLRSEAGDEA